MNLYLTAACEARWMALVNATKNEVMWYHYAAPYIDTNTLGEKELHFVIKSSIHVPMQTVTGVSVKVNANDAAAAQFALEEEGEGYFINTWAHSHVQMGVFASAIDNTDQKEHLMNNSYMLMIIINQRGEFFGEYWFKDQFGVIWKHKLTKVIMKDQSLKKEFEEIVQQKLISPAPYVPAGLTAGSGANTTARQVSKAQEEDDKAYIFWENYYKGEGANSLTYTEWCATFMMQDKFYICEWISNRQYTTIEGRVAQIRSIIISNNKKNKITVSKEQVRKDIEAEILNEWIASTVIQSLDTISAKLLQEYKTDKFTK